VDVVTLRIVYSQGANSHHAAYLPRPWRVGAEVCYRPGLALGFHRLFFARTPQTKIRDHPGGVGKPAPLLLSAAARL